MSIAPAGTRTVLFTDLVESTRVRTGLGDRAADDIRRTHDRLLARAVARSGGLVVKNTGDGVMAVFDSATAAVACAIEMQQGIEWQRRTHGLPLAIRVGLSAGDVVADGGDYHGIPVIEAARLEAAAHGDQILVSEVVRVLAGSRTDAVFRTVGPLELKGLGRPLLTHEVPWRPLEDEDSPSSTPEPGRVAMPEPLSLARSGPFVGRDAALAALHERWNAVVARRSEFVAIGGEPGIGKTRLAAEFATAVSASGATVLFGRCDAEAPRALQPVAEALDGYLRECDDEAEVETTQTVPGLALLVPRLRVAARHTTRALPDGEPFGSSDERSVVLDAVVEVVHRLAARAPVLFVVDDVHWATEPTVSTLRHLVRCCLPMPVMVLGTYRDTELGRTRAFASALAEMRREGILTRVPLQGLDEGEVRELATATIDPPDGSLVRLLHQQTQGNPFFLGELLRGLRDGASPDELPEGIKEAIGQRLSSMPDSVTRLLRVAAVAGQSFSFRVINDVPAIADGEDELLDALDAALDARLIVEHPAPGGGHYAFSHALIRQTVYTELSSARRSRLHLAVAEAIERQTPDPDADLAALAFHYTEGATAGSVDRAVEYARRAAEAVATVAAGEAIAILERTLDLVGHSPGSEDARADLLTLLHYPLRLSERWADARRACAEAIELARSRGDGARMARAVDGYVRCQELGRRDPHAAALVDEALDALGDANPGLRGRLLVAQSNEVIARGADWTASWPLLREAAELGHRSDDVLDRYWILWMALRNVWGSPLVDEQRGLLDELHDVERRLPPHLADRKVHLLFDARLRLELADPSFAAPIERWVELHAGAADLNTIGWRDYLRAALSLMQGDFAEAQALIESVLARCTEPNDRSAVALAQMFVLYRECGRLAEILPVAAKAIDDNPGLAGFRAALALAHAEIGDMPAARAVFDALSEDGFAAVPRDMTWTGSLFVLAEVCAVLGDAVQARILRALLEPYAGRMVVIADLALVPGAADRGLGQLAAVVHEWRDAEQHLRRALELETSLGAVPLATRTRYWLARTLLASGEPDRAPAAVDFLDAAARSAQTLGMTDLSARCTSVRERVLAPLARPRTPHESGG